MATFVIARGFDLNSNEALLADGTSYPGCDEINPMAFCYYGFWTENGDRFVTGFNAISSTEGIIIYSALILVLMLLDQCSIDSGDFLLSLWPPLKSHLDTLDAQLRKSAWPERLANMYDVVAMLRPPPGSNVKAPVQRCNLPRKIVASLSGLVIVFGYIFCFYMYFRELRGVGRPPIERSGAISTDIIQWKNWSSGQVVAVTVLLPPIFSYLAFEISKVHPEAHTAHLLTEAFEQEVWRRPTSPGSRTLWKVVAIALLQVTAERLAARDAIPLKNMAAAPATVSNGSHSPDPSMHFPQVTGHI